MITPSGRRLRVSVLGAGIVGRTLATGWVAAGHHVTLGSREPDTDRMRDAIAEIRLLTGGDLTATSHAEAAEAADILVVCVPGDQMKDLVSALVQQLDGRVVIDTTNNMSPSAAALNAVGPLTAAGAVTYRTFNTVGWEQMRQPVFGGIRSDMPYTGPILAKHQVEMLIADLGFRPFYLGEGPAAVEAVDSLAKLWFLLAFGQGHGRRLGLRFLTAADDSSVTAGDRR